jgi:hypothetical protein
VFPTESQAKPLDSGTVNAMLGSNLRFITESEVPPPGGSCCRDLPTPTMPSHLAAQLVSSSKGCSVQNAYQTR